MSQDLIIIIATIIIGLSIVSIIIKKWLQDFLEKAKPSEDLLTWLRSTNERLDSQNQQIVTTLQASTRTLNERLDNAAKFISSLQKDIGEISEIGRGIKDIEDYLKSPKIRGNIGEHILAEILTQILPKQFFHLQYTFKTGSTVDAAVITGNGIIPIDSKFPLENFRRLQKITTEQEKKVATRDFSSDVKKHIDDISKKYILTDEGTCDYALMYIPSEAVFYEVVNNVTLFEYASLKRVYPVSPTTFYAYMRAILVSFEGARITKEVKKILQILNAIHKDYEKIEDNMGILSRHITNAYNQMNNVSGSFQLLGQKLSSTKQLPDSS